MARSVMPGGAGGAGGVTLGTDRKGVPPAAGAETPFPAGGAAFCMGIGMERGEMGCTLDGATGAAVERPCP